MANGMILGCGSVVVDVLKKVPLFTVGDKTKIIDQDGRSKTLIAGVVTLNNLVGKRLVESGVFGRLGNDDTGVPVQRNGSLRVNHDISSSRTA